MIPAIKELFEKLEKETLLKEYWRAKWAVANVYPDACMAMDHGRENAPSIQKFEDAQKAFKACRDNLISKGIAEPT